MVGLYVTVYTLWGLFFGEEKLTWRKMDQKKELLIDWYYIEILKLPIQ